MSKRKRSNSVHSEDEIEEISPPEKVASTATKTTEDERKKARFEKKYKIPDIQMVRAIATRWNSLAVAIGRALKLRAALVRLVTMSKYDKVGKKGLAWFKLSEQEWTLLEQLHAVLLMFLQATERVSQSDVPLLHEVMPVIDILTSKLVDAISDAKLPTQIRFAAALGYEVLNKYYSATDESIMYRCAMMLHPKYKLEYFRRQKWQPSWIATAKEILREQWEAHYKPTADSESSTAASQMTDPVVNMFASLDTADVDLNVDALDEWLQSPPLQSVNDPLGYWSCQLNGPNKHLARMSLDFLSVPAASTDVERAFSRGGLTVSKRRHSLNDESTRAATVLSSWAAVPGLIPEQEIVSVFANKAKRSKKQPQNEVEVVD